MTGKMKAYLVFAGLVVGVHALGGSAGWWKGVKDGDIMDIRGGGSGSGSSGHSGFRWGK